MRKEKLKVYLDTSVISAYFDERLPERMKLTKESWQKIKIFDLYISEITFRELNATTDPKRRKQFLKFIKGFNVLPLTAEAKKLARVYAKTKIIPLKFKDDIFQIAIAVINNVDYILSWNFKHMVNLTVKSTINAVNVKEGYPLIEILAPAEML
jgi:predicted nucleic acid-binding protein